MKKFVSEFIGTLCLVLFGCGTAVAMTKLCAKTGMSMAGTDGQTTLFFQPLAIALAFGLVLTAVIYCFGKRSGAHVNPAVSVAMLLCGKMTVMDFLGYIAAQIAGAFAGAALIGVLMSSFTNLGANGYLSSSAIGANGLHAILIECILTFVFVLVILCVTEKAENKSVAGIVIGLTLTLVHIVGLPFTGTSVNPARSLAPAVLQGGIALSQVWVFIFAPIAGAALAAFVYMTIIQDKEKPCCCECDTAKEDTCENFEDIPAEQGICAFCEDAPEEACACCSDAPASEETCECCAEAEVTAEADTNPEQMPENPAAEEGSAE